MSILIYTKLEEKLRVLDEEGNSVNLTCVEGDGCNGCYFKREPGKPQYPFCNAVACGDFERLDDRDVIFQQIKVKDED